MLFSQHWYSFYREELIIVVLIFQVMLFDFDFYSYSCTYCLALRLICNSIIIMKSLSSIANIRIKILFYIKLQLDTKSKSGNFETSYVSSVDEDSIQFTCLGRFHVSDVLSNDDVSIVFIEPRNSIDHNHKTFISIFLSISWQIVWLLDQLWVSEVSFDFFDNFIISRIVCTLYMIVVFIFHSILKVYLDFAALLCPFWL